MSAFVGVIVGLLQGFLSLFGLGQSAPVSPQLPPDIVINPAQQTIIQATNIVAGSNKNPVTDVMDAEIFTWPEDKTALSVPGMTKYTDSDFGFSFWYPSGWSVQSVSTTNSLMANPNSGLLKILEVAANDASDRRITISEFASSSVQTAGCIKACGDVYEYYFDRGAHTWMVRYPHGIQDQRGMTEYAKQPGTIETADVSSNTMGGLHELSGVGIVVPLSAQHFLVVSGNSWVSGIVAGPLLNTIVATDPSVATPVSTAEQLAAIQAEARAYGVVTPPQSLKTYNDTVHGFSIQYPDDLTPKAGAGSGFGGFSGLSAEDVVQIQSKDLNGSAYGGPVSVSISVSADPTDVGNCMVAPQSSEESVNNVSTVQINGVSFRSFVVGDAAMGHYTSVHTYKTIKNNACYDISERTDSSRTQSDAEAKAQQDDINAAKAAIDPIVQSFTFMRDMSAAPAPTCTLSKDKFTYKLGDVITLTWKSSGARRALWDQAAEQNTGVRKVIVPPEGTPAINGTASTIANIEGFVPIKMQVVGDGGFGTCSTQVSVTHSDAKPSITVDSVSISQKTDYTNSRNVEVTVSGTATNGALYNNEVNVVLFDPEYAGPFDENSVYSADRKYFYSGGTQPGVRDDAFPFKTWSAESYIPHGVTKVRVLAYYPFYGTGPYDASVQPIVNEVFSVKP